MRSRYRLLATPQRASVCDRYPADWLMMFPAAGNSIAKSACRPALQPGIATSTGFVSIADQRIEGGHTGLYDPVTQNADAFNFEFHNVAGFQRPVHGKVVLDQTPPAHRS